MLEQIEVELNKWRAIKRKKQSLLATAAKKQNISDASAKLKPGAKGAPAASPTASSPTAASKKADKAMEI